MKYITRLKDAFLYSIAGLKAAARLEAAFQTELALFPIILIATVQLGNNLFQQAILIAAWLLLMLVELLNSAIEAVVDRISLERHELSGLAKDLGSAAVFIAIVINIIAWAAILAA